MYLRDGLNRLKMSMGSKFSALANKISKPFKFLVFVYFALLCLSVVDLGFVKSEVTAYPIFCKQKLSYGVCSDPEYSLRRTHYKLIPSRQEVLHWIEGSNVERLTKCAIKDRTNWSCKYNDESAEFGFTDGRYWKYSLKESSSADLLERVYYVSKTEWRNQSCKDSGMPYLICLPLISWLR